MRYCVYVNVLTGTSNQIVSDHDETISFSLDIDEQEFNIPIINDAIDSNPNQLFINKILENKIDIKVETKGRIKISSVYLPMNEKYI